MRRIFLVGAVLLSLMTSGTTSVLAADLDEYRQTLQAALADLERGTATDVKQAISRLRSIESVKVPDGTVVPVDHSAILEDLATQEPAIETAKTRLRAMLTELNRSELSEHVRISDAKTSLERVFDRREFRPDPPPNPVVLFLRWIREAIWIWLNQIFGRVLGGEAVSRNVRTAIEAIGLLVIATLLAWVVLRFRREIGSGVAALPVDHAAPHITSEEARAEAERLARAGNFRAAARAVYVAALLHWDELGRLRFDRSLTNQEVLAKARAQGDSALVAQLAPLVERFDRFWYGGIAPSPEDYAGFARLAMRAWEGT